MKKLKIMALTAVTALSCTFSAFASSSVPTQYKYLGTGPYSWSAYINGYKLYSNYNFGVYDGNFGIIGDVLYPTNKTVDFTVYNTSNGDCETLSINTSNDFRISDQTEPFNQTVFESTIYFSIDGTASGAEVSINGTIETYLDE